ncbi:hypothetical protein [Candidatus Mycoplasma mahonii]|uniref:hypothetical protein n=1 Tax=Candidatus Mycoplasma mahonii TaxID=3004105 RepID=UPI0026EF27DC|nr:hypothetical protein [Candidatus Mycoplasma mahonii]WKX02566.1 hypothetical protein O3I44_00605 [Candidatus Mycoplasma mahonii]
MNSTENIILWTVSLTLGVTGILFGIIASYNSRKANKSLTELIHNSRNDDLARKFFFDHPEELIAANKKAIRCLQNVESTYFDYSIINTGTRLIPINQENQNKLKESIYADLASDFLEIKKALDPLFIKVLGGKSFLYSTQKMPSTKRKLLIEYHRRVIDSATVIIKTFANGMDSLNTSKI